VYRTQDGPHSLKIRVRGNGPVRLFGVAVERERPGVMVDTLGINGARAAYQLLWDADLYREHLRRRDPDLVVLAYGTNESGDDGQPIEEYEADLRRVVARMKEAVPEASCLLIGPSDRPVQVMDDEAGASFEDRPRTGLVNATQAKVATELGCGYFDLVAFSGGPLSLVEWAASEPAMAQPDHIHYTARGYHRLGDVLHQALLEGYEGPAQAATPSSGEASVASQRPPDG
jgi:lysophospholipase L1-like esterase